MVVESGLDLSAILAALLVPAIPDTEGCGSLFATHIAKDTPKKRFFKDYLI